MLVRSLAELLFMCSLNSTLAIAPTQRFVVIQNDPFFFCLIESLNISFLHFFAFVIFDQPLLTQASDPLLVVPHPFI